MLNLNLVMLILHVNLILKKQYFKENILVTYSINHVKVILALKRKRMIFYL